MREARDIALLLADVDGTLVTDDKVLTSAAQAAVRDLHRAGIAFAITSGRPPRGMAMLIDPLKLDTAIAGFNGGVVVRPDLSAIEAHTLPSDAATKALGVIHDHGLDAWVYTRDEWLIRDAAAPHVAREAWTVKFDARVVPDFADSDLAHAVKITGVSDDLDRVAQCEKAVQAALEGAASAACSQPYYLDVTHPRANKGEVVATLSRLLAIPAARIATIGDMPTDVQMFKAAGFSIAMGNASEAVQHEADAVTASNGDEGFAKAVRRFLLREDA
jgi:Cof subfamily protein (haloacid dehalogenase superfamily)